jgi:hypothetical protein
LHCGFASVAFWQYPALEQATKSASISKQSDSDLQVYSQKPSMQAWGAPPLQSLVCEQFVCGRVSGWHAPWLQ